MAAAGRAWRSLHRHGLLEMVWKLGFAKRTVLVRALSSHPTPTSTGPSLPQGQGGGTEPWGHPRSISAVK